LTQSWIAVHHSTVTDDRCPHDLIVGQCVDCAPVPAGLPRRVYRTAGGTVFHQSTGCSVLLDGQRSAAARGLRTHPAVAMPVREALAAGLGACLVCFPYYRPAGEPAKPCLVFVDGQWRPGSLLRWQRRVDGGWAALVSCSVDGAERTFVETQDNLRPRR
jgi:hypothetical protein